MNLCGEPDRPEVQKNIDDLDNSMLTITAEFDKRSRSLEEALEKSMLFQDELMVRLLRHVMFIQECFFGKVVGKILHYLGQIAVIATSVSDTDKIKAGKSVISS